MNSESMTDPDSTAADSLTAGPYDLLIDMSACALDQAKLDRHVAKLLKYCGFADVVDRLSVVLPPSLKLQPRPEWPGVLRSSADGAGLFDLAVEEATVRRRALLVVIGPLLPSNEVLLHLWRAVHSDPLLGVAQPRFADARTDGIFPFPYSGEVPSHGLTSKRALAELPEIAITAELLSSCLLLRREVVAALGPSGPFRSLPGALALGLCRARRKGYRNVVSNRAVVVLPADPSEEAQRLVYPKLESADMTTLLDMYPDHARAGAEIERRASRRLEQLLAAAHPPALQSRRLLLDFRGMSAIHNGTSQVMLGLLDGLSSVEHPSWEVVVQSQSEAARFHGLAERYPGLVHAHGDIAGAYAAALMPNQPWALETVAQLHRHALVNIFNILDTIAWDVLYAVDLRVEETWRFIAAHADGLAYISSFSRQRFQPRFPVKPCVQERVIHLSLDGNDHSDPAVGAQAPLDHVLLFGNDYDHKDLVPTLQVLSDAFPLQKFMVLGAASCALPRVEYVPSGQVSGDEVHRLIATAQAVVFPSHYEGFGLPVVESLAYGRSVLVRKSALWDEIAAHSCLPGRMIEFDDTVSLVEGLGRVLAGLPVSELSCATALADGVRPPNWHSYALDLLDFVEECLHRTDIARWTEREHTLTWMKL
ncbi:glycosyltransferase [Variovorax paradoxus]|uniref:glycosyltransferase n=1 Tax=Variovorax paradoxus TaxID=34073 RepID=UPI0018AD5C5E|nr:glycosyltransferase [Variovorax paradoxus]